MLDLVDIFSEWVQVQGKLITHVMNGTLVANRCNHQVLWIE